MRNLNYRYTDEGVNSVAANKLPPLQYIATHQTKRAQMGPA